MKKEHQPKAAKGSARAIEVACSAWLDLLGYGSMLEEASYDLLHPITEKAIERIHIFHEIVGKHSCKYMPTFVMNDGAIVYRDMSPRAKSVTYDFLQRTVALFYEINEVEKKHGYPGARMVFAAGFRARRKLCFYGHLNSDLANSIRTKLKRGTITIDQGINEALKARQQCDAVPELQANFAMTKAYLADTSGRKAGLGGPNCYIDLSIFSAQIPTWIKFDDKISWSDRGMKANFGKLAKLDRQEAGRLRHAGILDAFDIAANISKVTDASAKLKGKRIRKLSDEKNTPTTK